MYRIFVSMMAYDKGRSGISDYSNNVVKHLASQNKLDIAILESDLNAFPVKNENINFLPISDKLANPLINMLWHLFILPMKISRQKYDFVFLPAGNRRIFCRYPVFTITTFHDLSQFHIEQKYDKFRMFYIRKVVPFFLKKVEQIVAVSNATKQDIIEFYGIPENKITVIYNGFNEQKFNNKPAGKSIAEILGKNKKYILYVARIEHPGKNHLNLVKAYEKFPDKIKKEYDLVCAGGFKERSEEVLQYAKNSPDSGNINFTGFFPMQDLVDLYKNASVFAMPSFYEGFGIPLVEAMACGIPIACSDRGPLPEVGGKAVLLFDPDDPSDISNKIETILSDEKKRKEIIDSGLDRKKTFDWKQHAESIIKLFEDNYV